MAKFDLDKAMMRLSHQIERSKALDESIKTLKGKVIEKLSSDGIESYKDEDAGVTCYRVEGAMRTSTDMSVLSSKEYLELKERGFFVMKKSKDSWTFKLINKKEDNNA